MEDNKLRPIKPSDLNFTNPACPVRLEKDEYAVIVFDNDVAKKIFSSVENITAYSEGNLPEKLMACGYIGDKSSILAEAQKYDNDPKYSVHIVFPQPQEETLRPLTFGDFEDDCLKLGYDEAAIIVIDNSKAMLMQRNPEVNPFVAAYAGSPKAIMQEKAKYENNPRYFVQYFPPAS